jgi:hypothetical protein
MITTIKEWKQFKLNESINLNELPIMYHGTNTEFDKFSLKHFGGSDFGWLGYGIYVTNDYDYAKSYTNNGNVKSIKLNIKNPYIITGYSYSTQPEKLMNELSVKSAYELTKKLKLDGYDSVMLKNINEITYDKDNKETNIFYEICIFDTETIKIL